MTSRRTLVFFIVISLALHAAAVMSLSVSEGGPAAAGPPAALVAQGNSFEDLVEGIPTGQPDVEAPMDTAAPAEESDPLDTPRAEPPQMAQPAPLPEAAAQAAPEPSAEPAAPEARDAPAPETGIAVPPELRLNPDEINQTAASIAATATPAQTQVDEASEPVAAPALEPTVAEITPAETAPTVAANQVTSIEAAPLEPVSAVEADRIEALPEVQVQQITAETVRPPTRPDDLGKTPPPAPSTPPRAARQETPRQAAPRQSAPAPRGNSNQSAQRGQASGTQRSGTARAGQGGRADAAAQAAARQAAANYSSAVMRKISRTRRERARSRGVANVGFRVASSGALASVRILSSSGDPALDQIALNHIRRSAPFPPPPPGAQTSFSIEFRGR